MNPETETQRRFLIYASLVWLITFAIISLLVIDAPTKRSVVPVYIKAVENWVQKTDLYTLGNYHYLPQFVFIYYPFYILGSPLGDVVWRLISLAIFVIGIWQLVNHLFSEQRHYFFLVITLLVVTPTIGALRNGQANLIFAGMLLLIVYFILVKRWWVVSFLLVSLIMTKQIGLVITGLVIFAYPQVALKIALFTACWVLLPFVFSDHDYVISQYISAIGEMTRAVGLKRSFADINGFLALFGLKLEGLYSISIRVFAGLLTLLTWLYIKSRFAERYIGMYLMVLSTGYLMLFHPMTEQNSYVIVSVPIAIFALMLHSDLNLKYKSYLLMSICVSLGILPELVRRLSPDFGMWYKPFSILVVFGFMLNTMRIFEGLSKQKVSAVHQQRPA
ncbi:MAG: glycosyltransferase family 87 protein [Thermodesulfovibrionales bacterium]